MNSGEYFSIAISGEAGTGKTTIAQQCGALLGWEVFGAGELFTEWCQARGISTNGADVGPDDVHDEIDSMMRDKMMRGRSVVEGRVAGLVAVVNRLPGVLKVLLVCAAETRYERIYWRERDKFRNLAHAIQVTDQRENENLATFSQRYSGLSYLDPFHYDLLIDTTNNPIESVVSEIVS